jgi:hypothetical protein
MKLLILSVLVFAFCAIVVPQEINHAPTLEACTADSNLWLNQIPGWPSPPTLEQIRVGTRDLTAREILKRNVYLNTCGIAYPKLLNQTSHLTDLSQYYATEVDQRLVNFLQRHTLLNEFSEEDEAGKR